MRFRAPLAVLVAATLPAFAQKGPDGPDKTIDATERKAVLDGALAELNKSYVFPEVAKKMEEAIRARQANKEYDAVSSGKEFARLLTTHLQEVSKDKHLRIFFSAEPRPKDARPSAEERERQRERQRRFATQRNYAFKKVERLDGGVGLLELEAFMRAEDIGETAAAAMSFLANSDSIIVDLRKNGGGDPAAVILLCSYFFKDQTHLNSIYSRPDDTTREYWSHPAVPGKKLLGKELYVLTSSRTFSGAEEFAYNIQSQKRGTIIGETTGGGAHPTMGRPINDHFGIGVPFARSINPVTKTNWEGTGVKPDVAVPADQALLTAHVLALKKSLEGNTSDKDAAEQLKRLLDEKEKELAALKAKTDK